MANIVGQHKMLANFLNTRQTFVIVGKHMLANICLSCVRGFMCVAVQMCEHAFTQSQLISILPFSMQICNTLLHVPVIHIVFSE